MSNIGRMIKDFHCNGFFGREYNNEKAIIEAEGYDWLVIRRENKTVGFAHFEKGWQLDEKQELIDSWCSEIEEDV